MKKALFGLGLVWFSTASIWAEDEALDAATSARIIGGVRDGRPSEPNPPKPLPDSRVLGTQILQDGERTITMKRVAPPVLPSPEVPREMSAEEITAVRTYLDSDEFKRTQASEKRSEFCFVSAIVYEGGVSRVMWWHKNEPFVAWSNFDWSAMGGFNQFEGRGQRFDLILGVGAGSAEAHRRNDPDFKVPVLPDVQTEGPKYVLVSGDAENEIALKFMDVLHDLYESDGERLRQASLVRERHRKEREAHLKANPPKPKDVEIQFWRRPRSGGSHAEGGGR